MLAGIFDAFFCNPPDASQRFSRGIIHPTEAGGFFDSTNVFSVLFRPFNLVRVTVFDVFAHAFSSNSYIKYPNLEDNNPPKLKGSPNDRPKLQSATIPGHRPKPTTVSATPIRSNTTTDLPATAVCATANQPVYDRPTVCADPSIRSTPISAPQYAQYQYGQQPYVNPQPADTGSFGWAVLGFFIPPSRTHPIPHLEDREAGERKTGRNGSTRISHHQCCLVAYCLHARSRGWKHRSLLTFYELLAQLCLSGGLFS